MLSSGCALIRQLHSSFYYFLLLLKLKRINFSWRNELDFLFSSLELLADISPAGTTELMIAFIYFECLQLSFRHYQVSVSRRRDICSFDNLPLTISHDSLDKRHSLGCPPAL